MSDDRRDKINFGRSWLNIIFQTTELARARQSDLNAERLSVDESLIQSEVVQLEEQVRNAEAKQTSKSNFSEMKKCFFCHQSILGRALVCRYCYRVQPDCYERVLDIDKWISIAVGTALKNVPVTLPVDNAPPGTCSYCRQVVALNAMVCHCCGRTQLNYLAQVTQEDIKALTKMAAARRDTDAKLSE